MPSLKRILSKGARRFAARLVDTEEVHDALALLIDRSARALPLELRLLKNEGSPYAPDNSAAFDCENGAGTVFVTSRFRSGSTALWSAFRRVDGVTAYYEPFNERRFFDPTTRGAHVDRTHIGVDDYAAEYDATTGLSALYEERWVRRELFMGEGAWNPRMKRFIDQLISCAPERTVLQFNRIDFRLPWLRRHYPLAHFVHLYRHPREQWCSFLIDIHEFPRDVHPDRFTYRFYLDRWARDLQHVMPLLRRDFIEHPYDLFYLIWKLSYLFGRRYATHSLSFEDLVASPLDTLKTLVERIDMADADVDAMRFAISAPRAERWREYANDAWFIERETYCEALLDEFLIDGSSPDTRGSVEQPLREPNSR